MKIILSVLLVIFIVSAGRAQTVSQKIAKIRDEVEKINNGKGYKIVTLSNEQFLDEMTDGGGELMGYYKNGELVKIDEKIYLSSCIHSTTYFVKQNELIFAYTQGKEWFYDKRLDQFDPKKIMLKMELRFYFENSKMISSNLKGETRCSGKPNSALSKRYTHNFKLWKKKLLEK